MELDVCLRYEPKMETANPSEALSIFFPDILFT